jgi:hypothetical protein
MNKIPHSSKQKYWNRVRLAVRLCTLINEELGSILELNIRYRDRFSVTLYQ